jgi:hypothetical protein
VGVAVVAVGLFLLYWRQARSEPVSSDAASIILQAADMLHGNLLLHGWVMADVSFYSTELVQYMLLQAVLPMSPGLVFVAGAMTYTILVLLAGYIAKGRATGREAVLRAFIGSGIMLAPALGDFTGVLMHAPDHLGSAVPVLLAWLVIDRCAPRWYVPVAVCLLLAWGQIADPLVEVTGAAAMVLACGVRFSRHATQRRNGNQSGSPLWIEVALVAAALSSVGIAKLAEVAMRASGGYVMAPVVTQFAGLAKLGAHAVLAGKGLLGLFGAVFWTGQPGSMPPFQVFSSCLHLIGVALVVAAFVMALWRFFRRDDLLVAGLVVSIAANIIIFIASTYPTNLLSIREMSEVLPFAAVLAGRLLAGPVARLRLTPALALACGGYLVVLGVNSTASPSSQPYASVAEWLSAHHLTSGLSTGYWQSNILTVDSRGTVAVRQTWVSRGEFRAPGGVGKGGWEFNAKWYDPAVNRASFLLTVAPSGSPSWEAQLRAAERSFGHPAMTYHYDGFTIFTWRGNLLARLGSAPAN